ncbi:hypothetical protein CFOLD11_40630 [Clostridium folliculivorans]|uniref:Transposase IS204/IS1001/IS1096/IS1165 zinc-finger domain-containing protein n=1 Tax=Clostridium folliculivorans TaxID=2886038 RepID=A0A9W5Y5W2_9CLOT|nr:transposase family protein [Clostridium folliculivorans]GKU27236.1 hypothetical protein CFOLD11_40630 [Clostridium folliculivorans]
MINEIFFDKFKVDNIEHDENKVLIILKSTNLATKCTCCGVKTTKVHSKYKRQVLDLPIFR